MALFFQMPDHFLCGEHKIDLTIPRIMGIVNVTPDSFYDGGKYDSTDLAVQHALELVAEGADILDIGGESTRPHASPVSLEEELRRVIPVIQLLKQETHVPLSIDTYKPEVMQQAMKAGVDMINDVRALQEPSGIETVADSQVGVCLMHMQGTPQTMQIDPQYEDVVIEVKDFLKRRLDVLLTAGVDQQRIMLDPGFGFGKRTVHNIMLLRSLHTFTELGCPILVGLSRKSILGQMVGADVDQRLHASLAASVVSAMKGASFVRVHDVKATAEAFKVLSAIM